MNPPEEPVVEAEEKRAPKKSATKAPNPRIRNNG